MATTLMHIFKAGRQTTSAGVALEFSEADLAACAAAYDPAKHEAPLCIGHPQHDLPAYGWVKALRAQGSELHAERHQVDPAFVELARGGKFKKVSAAFYAPDSPNNPVPGVYYLRHVAMLGAQPPAVKGLKPVEFADAEEGVLAFAELEFAEPAYGLIARLFRGLRDHLIESQGLDKANQALPDYNIAFLDELASLPEPETDMGPAYSEPTTPPAPKETPMTAPTPSARELELQAQLDAANAQLQAQRDADAQARRAALAANALAFAEGLVSANQLLPADKALVASVLAAVEGEQPVEFGEGEAKKPAGAALRELLAKLPKHALNAEHIATNQHAGGQFLSDAQKIADKAVEFQEAQHKLGRHVDIAYAVQHVTQAG